MDASTAREELTKLRTARDLDLVTYREASDRAAAILDRSPLAPLSIVDYLKDRGHQDHDLFSMAARLATAVKGLHIQEYGSEPLHRAVKTDAGWRDAHAYIEDDRHLFDRAYEQITAPTLTLLGSIR